MNKFFIESANGVKHNILSVTSSDNVEGYIYVEAFKEIHVSLAINGLNLIFGSKLILVPYNEMVQVYGVDKAENYHLRKNQWVRIKQAGSSNFDQGTISANKVYTGDLAKVLMPKIQDGNSKVLVKIVPRIDFEAEIEEINAERKKGKKKVR